MHYVHTGEAAVTSIKIDIFLLVTARPIAHSGKFVCIRNGVGEFGMDSGQPLVTRKECESAGVIITRRITLIFECTHKVYALIIMWHTGEFLVCDKMYHNGRVQVRKCSSSFSIAHGGVGVST